MPPDMRTLPAGGDVAQTLHTLRTFFDVPRAWCSVTAGAEAADVRRITLQVRDRLRNVWKRRWRVHFYLTTTEGGNPGGTQTVVFVSGTLLDTHTANVRYTALTDADGKIEIDVGVIGAGTRFVYADVIGEPVGLGFAWT